MAQKKDLLPSFRFVYLLNLSDAAAAVSIEASSGPPTTKSGNGQILYTTDGRASERTNGRGEIKLRCRTAKHPMQYRLKGAIN